MSTPQSIMLINPRPEEEEEEQDGDDGDSLFGSPPPSPQQPTGRPTPSMCTSSSGSRASTSTAPARQNVGTIALPGSQPDSEFPINPLALSLNYGIVQRPPAQLPPAASAHTSYGMPRGDGGGNTHSTRPQTSGEASASASTPQSLITPLGSSLSRPPKPKTSSTTTTSKKKPKKASTVSSSRSSKESTPQPPQPRAPEFALPDPTAPPPSHFLRNQENLLGRAGRVAGVKPFTLTHNTNTNTHTSTHTRGSTPSNPILVDDEDDTPVLGRRRQRSPSRDFATPNTQPYIDPALLTAPTNQEIVSVLIGQKDIFPILEGVLKLVVRSVPGGNGAPQQQQPRPTGFERRPLPVQQQQYQTFAHQDQGQAAPSPPSSSAASTPTAAPAPAPSAPRPKKKRKLSRVPAGATDWDVPYPFAQGEGPDAYRTTWERERGKQLIAQLIRLIKSAARKAATKKYLSLRGREEEAVRGWRNQTGGQGQQGQNQNWRRGSAGGGQGSRREGHYRPDVGGAQWNATAQTQTQMQGQGQSAGQVDDVLQDTSNVFGGASAGMMMQSGHVQPSALSNTGAGAGDVFGTTGAGTQMQPIASLQELLESCAPPSSGAGAGMMNGVDYSMFDGSSSSAAALMDLNTILGTGGVGTGDNNSSLFSNPDASAAAEAEAEAAMDQTAFDSWMNFLVDAFPTSFDGSADANVNVNANNANANANADGTVNTTSTNASTNVNTSANTNTAQPSSDNNSMLTNPSNSVSNSHCSTPGPDEFSFAGLFGGAGGVGGASGGAGVSDYDLAAMLAAIINQPQAQAETGAGADKDNGKGMGTGTGMGDTAAANANAPPTTTTTIGDQMIDPSLLALSLGSTLASNPNSSTESASINASSMDTNVNADGLHLNLDTNTNLGINPALPPSLSSSSPSASTSSFVSGSSSGSGSGNDPATPASAGWDSGIGTGAGGQDWEKLVASAESGAAGVAMDMDEEDFGVLPEVVVDGEFDDGGGGGLYTTTMTAMAKVDHKGKGRAMDIGSIWTPTPTLTPTATSTHTNTRATNTPAPTSASATAQTAFRALLAGGGSGGATSIPASTTFTTAAATLSAGTAASSSAAALESARSARKARRDDIIRRAQEKRRRVKAELDRVKMRLWETTVEQAALVHLVRRLGEEGEGAGESPGGDVSEDAAVHKAGDGDGGEDSASGGNVDSSAGASDVLTAAVTGSGA